MKSSLSVIALALITIALGGCKPFGGSTLTFYSSAPAMDNSPSGPGGTITPPFSQPRPSVSGLPIPIPSLAPSPVPSPISKLMGPLKQSTTNPRYYEKPDGSPVYLAGSHVETSRLDMGIDGKPFDYTAYLNLMKANHVNLIRLWTLEDFRATPTLYERTGPGNATDGNPKFDLTKFNSLYFDRLRQRVQQARDMGMYVTILLFNETDWAHHPYSQDNSINPPDISNQSCGIVGYPDCGMYIYQAYYMGALSLQQTYAKKVVEAVNEFDNVLFEVIDHPKWPNPSPVFSFIFSEMMTYLKDYEKTLPLQHPFHVSPPYFPLDLTRLNDMFMFDWYSADKIYSISPYGVDKFQDNPPASESRVLIVNTEDTFAAFRGGDASWVWKQFTRGNSVLVRDSLTNSGIPGRFENLDSATASLEDSARAGILGTRQAAELVDLKNTVPMGSLSSTTYALADPGHQYVVFAPTAAFDLDLTKAAGQTFRVTWIDVNSGKASSGGTVSGGASQHFTPPSLPAGLILTK